MIFVRRLCCHARPIKGTEGARYPFFSPDGASIGFFANSTLKTVSLRDGSVLTVVESARGIDADPLWTADSKTVN